jgi:hypothetical protein
MCRSNPACDARFRSAVLLFGVFANASLFGLLSSELPCALANYVLT